MASTASTPKIRNPAPHRGFNAKAREVLLDSEFSNNNHGLNRTNSDGEFLRRLNNLQLMRTDSGNTNGSQKSHASSTQSFSGQVSVEFNTLDDLPHSNRVQPPIKHKFLGEIGKTKSTGDLFKRKVLVHTFKQANIMKLPSVESDIGAGDMAHPLSRSNSSTSISDGAQLSNRQFKYAMK